jgi:hypothetical protein
MTRTYMIYAGDIFLGYEYGDSQQAVMDLAHRKFGPASNWNIENYQVKLITNRKEENV